MTAIEQVRRTARIVLGTALAALALLYAIWFHDDKYRTAALIIFALPPLLLLIGVLRGSAKAAFWAGVIGLFWFSHGVMVAYTRPAEAVFAWLEIALSIVVVLAASWPGLHARRHNRKRANG